MAFYFNFLIQKVTMKNRTTHYFKPMLCGAYGCAVASVLAFLKQGSSLQQCLIAGVVETAEVYAKMAHNSFIGITFIYTKL